MSSDQSCNESLIALFAVHLRTEAYSEKNSRVYIAQAREGGRCYAEIVACNPENARRSLCWLI